MSDQPHEIVIIRRRSSGHEDEHHGGVWKIAFADFMTAMMAFFLVMWLISANDKTKAVIARYFNPVQLVDSTPQPKGLEDPKADSPSIMPKAGAPAPEPKDRAEAKEAKAEAKGDSKAAPEAKQEMKASEPKPLPGASAAAGKALAHDEAALFRDPYAVLAEIAGKNQVQPARDQTKAASEGSKGGSGAVGLKGGEAYRDPFEPLPIAGNAATEAAAPQGAEILAPTAAGPQTAATPPSRDAPTTDVLSPKAPALQASSEAGAAKADASAAPNEAGPGTLAARIEVAVKQTVPAGPGGLPHLEIHQTAEGTVIDLTDGATFSMFASASAKPAASMVALMEKIGRLLKGEKGSVTIRGYTDNRPFKSDTYDNWRLSSARAHMAHYMLVRGGLDEGRIERIEGYADRQPKNPKDPGAAENRRIEILLRDPVP